MANGEGEMKQLRIQRGSTWLFVSEDGRVKTKEAASKDWVILGALSYDNFGHVSGYVPLEDIFRGDIKDWKYKNGKQKWFIQDCDHGSLREWRSPDYRCWVEENVKE